MAKYMLLTSLELAEEIAKHINTENVLESAFPNCDFAIFDGDVEEFSEENANDISLNICGWYGMKAVDLGFDSENLIIVADYYGGGCLSVGQFYNGIYEKELIKELNDIIVEALMYQEVYKPETKLFVEFHE